MIASRLTGATGLCVFEQICDPGAGAPPHTHAVEEVLTILSGTAEAWVDGTTHMLGAGAALTVAPGASHGFRNGGQGPLRVMAVLAAGHFEAAFDGVDGITRRWALD